MYVKHVLECLKSKAQRNGAVHAIEIKRATVVPRNKVPTVYQEIKVP